MWHDAALQKETVQINSSLMALKDCVRAKAQVSNNAFNRPRPAVPLRAAGLRRVPGWRGVSQGLPHVPYRLSKLTQLLKQSFSDGSGKRRPRGHTAQHDTTRRTPRHATPEDSLPSQVATLC